MNADIAHIRPTWPQVDVRASSTRSHREGPNVYIAFQAQQGSAGADVDGVTTSGWGHVHTIYRDPTNDYAGSVEQQAAVGMTGGPNG